MHFKTFKVPNAVRNWAASGTLHYVGMLYDIFTFLLMDLDNTAWAVREFVRREAPLLVCHVRQFCAARVLPPPASAPRQAFAYAPRKLRRASRRTP